MRERLFVVLVLLTFAGFCADKTPAQLPGGLRIPKISKPKPTPTESPRPSAASSESEPTPSSESHPAATAQPDANNNAPAQPIAGFDKGWLMVRTLVVSSYKGNFDTWSWTPVVEFRDRSGLPSGAKYYAEFMQPTGSPWIRLPCDRNGDTFTCVDRDDAKGATYAGLIPFAIKIRTPLQGTEQTVFTGKAKIEKAPSSDVERNKLSYYVNHDWALPIGYVFRRHDNQLGFAIWLHTDNASGLEPHVFYNGAEVGLATYNGEPVGHASCGSEELEAAPSRDVASSLSNKGKWVRMGCNFTNVYWGNEGHAKGVHLLNRNPGEYEIKVLWNKRLARSIKFSINPDGSIRMKKQLLVVAAALLTLTCLGLQKTSAQLPGGLRIPKISKPKPTQTEAPQTATPNESRPTPQPAVSSAPAQPQAAAGQGGIAVLKNQVWVNTRRVTSYKGDGSTYSWTPVIMFDTNGPIPSGAQYHASVSLPTGAQWVEMDCEWMRGDYYYRCGGPNFPEEKGTTATGVFPFTIKMRNELQGIDQTLFTGKVKIEKAPNEEGTPAERAKRSFFYPVHDWAMPIGYVYYGPEDNYLYTSFWVRGSTYNIKPHIFYKGKELDYGGTDKSSCNDRIGVGDAYIRTVKPAPAWSLVECRLYTLIVKDKGNRDDTRHRLMSNPGDYEIKVLWNDELARSIKFTVGPDGNFAGGTPLLYKIDGRSDERMPGIMVPVQIIGEQDGPWNKASWKTDAFYGNPPAGLAPAP